MEKPVVISYFEERFRTLNDKFQSLKTLDNDFDDETKIHFDDCRNHLERIYKSINNLNGLCAEENVLNEKYSKIVKNYVPTNFKTSNEKVDAVKVDIENVHVAVVICENSNENLPKQVEAQIGVTVQEPQKLRQNVNLSISSIKVITDDEFQSVPGYMKGRIRLAQINQIIEKFNEVLNKKYSLIEQSSKGACRENKEKYVRYKSQETSETKHQRFCMDEDLKETFSAKEIQTYNKQGVQILRHCKRIKEIRNGSLVRYVLLPH